MLHFPKTFFGQFMKGYLIAGIILSPFWVILIIWHMWS